VVDPGGCGVAADPGSELPFEAIGDAQLTGASGDDGECVVGGGATPALRVDRQPGLAVGGQDVAVVEIAVQEGRGPVAAERGDRLPGPVQRAGRGRVVGGGELVVELLGPAGGRVRQARGAGRGRDREVASWVNPDVR